MPCANTLAPAVGCRGPGSDVVCPFCRSKDEQEQKKKAVPPPVPKSKPVLGVARTPLAPSVARQMVAQTGSVATPLLLAQPAHMGCSKLPPPPPPRQLVAEEAPQPPAPKPVPPPRPKPKLVTLDVEGACGGPGNWWQVVSADRTVKVTAVTAPDAKWAWDQLSWGTNVQNVSLASAAPKVARCSLDGSEQSVLIAVYDLTALTVSDGVETGGVWKLYESNRDATLTTTTNPAQPACWSKLQWKAQGEELKPGLAANERKVNLATARDVKVSVTLGCSPQLGQKRLDATLHICRWPKLEVKQIFFNDSGGVVNDGTLEIEKLFDRMWIKGRPDPAPNTATALMQSPLRYSKGSAITLEAELAITRKPTETEQVWVEGRATVKGAKLKWQAQVTVDPAYSTVTFPSTASAGVLPDEVGKFDPMEIEWFQSTSDGTAWEAIGTTKHLLYVTLAARVSGTQPYWTLLDISCEAAAGVKTEKDFVPKAFVPFTTHVGDGKGFKRKGDGVALSYYIKGVDTDSDDWHLPSSPYHTKGILSRADGTGRCGGWADLLRHMFRIHGISSAREYVIIRPKVWNSLKGAWEANYNNRFLVKNCTFQAGTLKGALPYTHVGPAECQKQSGAPGQGKTNPQFDFGDHVYVEHDGKFYDPSYGLKPVASQFEYEEAAIDGLGAYGSQVNFNQAGTPQHIPSRCSPGYVERTVSASDTLDQIATKFQTTASAIFNHKLNAGLKTALGGDISKVQDGDTVYLPREWARKAKECMLYGYY